MKCCVWLIGLFFAAAQPSLAQSAFPGAVGWASETAGGRGGRIIRVTTLNADGPGSFKEAVQSSGPRILVFEVAGQIDLGKTVIEITEPFLTIAGQTAPSPGITLIRGGIDVKTHDVIIRHIRVRTGAAGSAKRSGWAADAISTIAARNVIVDHCTFMWGVDENMSASGPRFTGETVEEWRKGTSHNITYSYNLAAEGLADSSHPKGEHSKGSLIHDNATGIVYWRNLWAHNVERNPLLKGGGQAAVVNNMIYNPQRRAVHYNLVALEWAGHRYVTGELSAVGNVLRGGPSTEKNLPFLMLGGDGDLLYHGRDNLAVDSQGKALPQFDRYGEGRAKLIVAKRPVSWWSGLPVMPARDLETHLLSHAGARPWDRDAHDIRLLLSVTGGRGHVIDDESEVGGYGEAMTARAPFVEADWNMDTMEPRSGVYPGQKGMIQKNP